MRYIIHADTLEESLNLLAGEAATVEQLDQIVYLGYSNGGFEWRIDVTNETAYILAVQYFRGVAVDEYRFESRDEAEDFVSRQDEEPGVEWLILPPKDG